MAWHRVAEESDVDAGEAIVVTVGGKRLALCNTGESLHAIDDMCSHDRGPLDQGKLIGNRIECPRHGAQFDVTTGKALTLPAIRPIKTYPVRVEDGVVEVEV